MTDAPSKPEADKPVPFACTALERKIAELAWEEMRPAMLEACTKRAELLVEEAFRGATQQVYKAMQDAISVAAKNAAHAAVDAEVSKLKFDVTMTRKE